MLLTADRNVLEHGGIVEQSRRVVDLPGVECRVELSHDSLAAGVVFGHCGMIRHAFDWHHQIGKPRKRRRRAYLVTGLPGSPGSNSGATERYSPLKNSL